MDAMTNITTAASQAIFGEEATRSEAAGREPVSGQMGNVAVGEPYDKGNMDTERNNSHPTYGTAGDKSTNGSSVQQASVAANGKTGLYNPILPAGPGENGATDYTSGARRISGKSADSQNLGQQKSPVLQGVGQSEMASGSTSAQKNGLTYDESNAEARKTSDSGVTSPTREGGRRKSRQSSGSKSIDRGDLAFRSVSREAYRKQSERNALAPLHKTASARRRAAQASTEDGYEDEVDTGVADTSATKERKPSLKDRIKAKFSRN